MLALWKVQGIVKNGGKRRKKINAPRVLEIKSYNYRIKCRKTVLETLKLDGRWRYNLSYMKEEAVLKELVENKKI